jgi:acetyl-CoA acetyltransferase
MEKVVIAAGLRTAIWSFGGTLRNIPVYKLASTVFDEVVKRAGIEPPRVDDVIMGQSYQNGCFGSRLVGFRPWCYIRPAVLFGGAERGNKEAKSP